MRTDAMVAMLAANAAAVEPRAVERRFVAALGWGAFGATLLMALTLGVRPDLRAAAGLPMFWIKLAFPAAIAVASVFAVTRLARPGSSLGRVPLALVVPPLAVWALAAYALAAAAPGDRAALILGSTAPYCLVFVPLLSLPVLVAALWAMRGLAPTRLVRAGAATGLLAGSVAALVYVLHCPEMDAPFLAVFYAAGMAIPAVAGALLGPRLLRW
ncbi:MAG: DUF1109 domain-containing protein [Casimicrobiaceae bacterium]